MTEKTRLKLAYVMLAVGFAEAIAAAIIKGFPIGDLYAFQGVIIGYYFGGKILQDYNMSKEKREACNAEKPGA